MLFSVYTPSHEPAYLQEAYESLLEQQIPKDQFEWIIIANGNKTQEVKNKVKTFTNLNIQIYESAFTNLIGTLKAQACQHAKGKILVELDHDDMLVDSCLLEISKLYKDELAFYYSDWTGFDENNNFESYSEDYGWRSYHWNYQNKKLLALKSFEVTARSLCEIFFAPNHVRAFTKTLYDKINGYDSTLKVADDHDLIIRSYLAQANFYHIDKPLYLYRMHNSNTVKLLNSNIQIQQALNKDKYIHDLVFEETRRLNCKALNIGQYKFEHEFLDFINLDTNNNYEISNLSFYDYPDNTFNVIRLYDCLQLIKSKYITKVMKELHRILVPGGWLLAAVPSTDGRGAFQDPRHVSYWNQNSWLYYTDKNFSKHLYPDIQNTPKFQIVRNFTSYPSDWHKENNISYNYADLCSLKGQRQPGQQNF